MWKCRHCKETVDDDFDVCWNCGYGMKGEPPANPADFRKVEREKRKSRTRGSRSADSTNLNGVVIPMISIYLIGSFIWRAFTPAHEYDSQTVVYMTIAFDLLAVTCLIALKFNIFSGLPSDQSEGIWEILFWVALVAGLGLLALRFLNGDAGWWTGHLVYDLSRIR